MGLLLEFVTVWLWQLTPPPAPNAKIWCIHFSTFQIMAELEQVMYYFKHVYDVTVAVNASYCTKNGTIMYTFGVFVCIWKFVYDVIMAVTPPPAPKMGKSCIHLAYLFCLWNLYMIWLWPSTPLPAPNAKERCVHFSWPAHAFQIMAEPKQFMYTFKNLYMIWWWHFRPPSACTKIELEYFCVFFHLPPFLPGRGRQDVIYDGSCFLNNV